MPRLRTVLTVAAPMFILIASASPLRAEWNPALAARDLDARQPAWFDWKTARSHQDPATAFAAMALVEADAAPRR